MKYQGDSFYIDRVIAGDVSAYAPLVEKHKGLVFSIALKILNNREDAEEIAQDVFIKAYQSLRSFEKKSKFSTWLYRIAYNAAISKTRKKKPEVLAMDDSIVSNYTTDEITSTVEHMHEHDQMVLIEKALQGLSSEDNLLISLFYKGENSIEDISEVTGLSVSNVKVRLHRIRKRIYSDINEMLAKPGMN